MLSTSRGFSLIEAMIAITIAGILLAAGVPSFQSWIQNSQVRATGESVLNGFQLARAEAASRNSLVMLTLTATDWKVEVLADAPLGVAYQLLQSYSLPKKMLVTPSTLSLTFDGMGKVQPPLAVMQVIDIKNASAACAKSSNSGGVRCMQVQVKAGGAVRMCDPVLSLATNPQGCI